MGSHPDQAARKEKKGTLINLFRLYGFLFLHWDGTQYSESFGTTMCQAIGNNTLGFWVGHALLWHLCEG